MTIYEAVEEALREDLTQGFMAGFFGKGNADHLIDPFIASSRYLAVETVAKVLGIPTIELWNQYQEQARAAKDSNPPIRRNGLSYAALVSAYPIQVE